MKSGLASALVAWTLLAAAVVAGRSGAPRWIGAALAIAAATIFLARLSQRLLRQRLAPPSTPPPVFAPPPPRTHFTPRLPAQQAEGYVGFTENFSAEGALLATLQSRFDNEPARIAAIGFGGAYLARRIDAPWEWADEEASDGGDLPVAQEEILGWLAYLHGIYPDNAPSDSRVVLGALRVRALGLAAGRSTDLGLAEREFRIALNASERLGWSEWNERMDAHRAHHDLDPELTRSQLVAASRLGAALAAKHSRAKAAH